MELGNVSDNGPEYEYGTTSFDPTATFKAMRWTQIHTHALKVLISFPLFQNDAILIMINYQSNDKIISAFF